MLSTPEKITVCLEILLETLKLFKSVFFPNLFSTIEDRCEVADGDTLTV